MISSPTIVIRLARHDDRRALSDLAALDSRRSLAGPAMLAEVDGTVRAALDLADGSVAADPFFASAELVELLRLRARRLAGESAVPPPRRRPLERLRHRRRALSARA